MSCEAGQGGGQEVVLGVVSGQVEGAPMGGRGSGWIVEFGQREGAGDVEGAVALQGGIGAELIEAPHADGRSEGAAPGHGRGEPHDGTGLMRKQYPVQHRDLRPIGLVH